MRAYMFHLKKLEWIGFITWTSTRAAKWDASMFHLRKLEWIGFIAWIFKINTHYIIRKLTN